MSSYLSSPGGQINTYAYDTKNYTNLRPIIRINQLLEDDEDVDVDVEDEVEDDDGVTEDVDDDV